MMDSESMQTLMDPVFRSKMPLFDGTIASPGLSKPPNMPAFLDKKTLQYNGAYLTYDPRGKDRAGFTPPWSNSKTTLLDSRTPVSHLSGMAGQNRIIYRQDSSSSEEGHSHSSSMLHTPSKQNFTLYDKSREISSPTATVSVAIRKQKTGCENSSPHSENSVYLAIPKPVYRHSPCCNELGCVFGPPYSVEHGSPRLPNTVYDSEWIQSDAHYPEVPPIQRKAQDTLLQQSSLQFEPSADPRKRITVEAYSPGRLRTLPIIEPNYSSYPCPPNHTLFGSLSEHSQPLQTSPRGYPSLYPSHPTYEHMTSEFYQERSPMSKYGQRAQHPVFYYSQANVEVEKRTQCKDGDSKHREDVPAIHKHPIPNPREHYIVPQSLHAEIPLPTTEILPAHSFMQGFDYPYYAIPRFHLNASQKRAPLKRQHVLPGFHSHRINLSPPSQHKDHPIAPPTSPQKDKPSTSLHDQLKASSPFLRMDQNSPTRCVSQPGVSPSSIHASRFFSPLSGLHIDPAALPPAGLNMDRIMDCSSFEPQVTGPKQPKSLPVPTAAWLLQAPNHSSDRIHTAVPNSANIRKIIYSPVVTGSNHSGFVSSSGATVHKEGLKRSISHVSPPIKIKEEDKDLYEVDLAKKRQKLKYVKVGNKTESPPMPVIDTVFSLAPYQSYLQASRVIFPGTVTQKTIQSSEHHEVKPKPDIKEKRPERDEQRPVVGIVSKEICLDTPTAKPVVEVLEPKNIKVEKVDSSDTDHSIESNLSQNNYSKVMIKKEPEDIEPCDNGPMLLIKKCESDELESKPSLAGSDAFKPAVLTVQMNSSFLGNTCTLHKQVATLQSKSATPLQPPETKLNFKNIPPQCLKLSSYKIIIPDGRHSSPVPPPEKPPAQPKAAPAPKEIQMPVRKHFFELHHSLCKLVSKSVSASSEQELKNWSSQLEITEPVSPSTKVQKVSCLLGVKAREMWINEEMKSALDEVLQRLKEYTALERCPFPHVMRTGAVFLPMLVMKELLFPMVQGSFIDQVLQEHKVELRPTTLSEEKILIQLHKRACSSRLRRLMSLKHLPDIYTDVVNILYYTCVCKHLGLDMDPDYKEHDEGYEASDFWMAAVFSDITASAASPSESPPQRDMTDEDSQPHWNRNRTKSRVKGSSRRMFLDNSLSDEEAAGETEKAVVGGLLNTFPKENPGAHEYQGTEDGADHMGPEQESLLITQSTYDETSWTCPLTFNELSPSDRETEESSCTRPADQSSWSDKPQVRPKDHTGMILKLKRMVSKGLNRKKACYQAVPELGTFANCSISPIDDGEGVSSEQRTPKGTHRWQRTGSFSQPLGPLSSSSKRKRRSLLKIKYCPFLSACHSAEHRRRWVLRSAVQRARRAMRFCYPDLVGKRIRHLYEEDDKSEVWYRGEVLRIHEAHTNPLKTIFEVRYDSEPEWKYYLELLMDYKKGWLKIEG